MSETTQDETKKPNILVRLLPLFIIVGGFAFAYFQGWFEYLSLESLRKNIGIVDAFVENNFFLALGGFALLYALTTTFMLPGSVITLAGGAIFGLTFGLPLYGAGATVIGATLGASILFFAAKTSIGGILRDIAGPFLAKMEDEFNESPFSYMFVLRLVPAVPFAVANIAPGLLGAKYRDYLITTFFGIIPGTLAYSLSLIHISEPTRPY